MLEECGLVFELMGGLYIFDREGRKYEENLLWERKFGKFKWVVCMCLNRI